MDINALMNDFLSITLPKTKNDDTQKQGRIHEKKVSDILIKNGFIEIYTKKQVEEESIKVNPKFQKLDTIDNTSKNLIKKGKKSLIDKSITDGYSFIEQIKNSIKEKKRSLVDNLIPDGVFYVHHINGPRQQPDFVIIFSSSGIINLLNIECKSGKNNTIMWNDSFLKDNHLYVYSDTAINKTRLFFYSEEGKKLLSGKEFLQAMDEYDSAVKNLIKMGQDLKQISDNFLGFEGYPRKNLKTTRFPIEKENDCLSEVRKCFEEFFNIKKIIISNNMSELKAISLFSGAGGDTLGMEKANVNVIGFVEINKTCIETHKHNFPNSVLLGKDITKINDTVFLEYKDKINILFAGFPCQGFSHAGKKDASDKRNNLFNEFVRAANIMKPKWIIGENVKGILTMKTPEGISVVDIIRNEFTSVGYCMLEPFVIKCEELGIPQKRERCIFIGCLGQENHFNPLLIQKKPIVGIEDIIEETLENAIEINNNYDIEYFKELSHNIEVSGKHATNLLKCLANNELSFGKRSSPTHSEILDIRKPTKTIICSYGRMPRMFVPLKTPEGKMYLRHLTPNELKQIQGFDKEFEILGSMLEQINQIGNAVPPALISSIIEQIKLLPN